MTLPDDWRIYLDELITHFKDGKDSIRSGINELIENGYILRMRRRDENGRLREYVYDVFEVPSRIGKSNVGESNVGKSNVGKSYVGKSYVGKSNTTKYIYTQSNKKRLITNRLIITHKKNPHQKICVWKSILI